MNQSLLIALPPIMTRPLLKLQNTICLVNNQERVNRLLLYKMASTAFSYLNLLTQNSPPFYRYIIRQSMYACIVANNSPVYFPEATF